MARRRHDRHCVPSIHCTYATRTIQMIDDAGNVSKEWQLPFLVTERQARDISDMLNDAYHAGVEDEHVRMMKAVYRRTGER